MLRFRKVQNTPSTSVGGRQNLLSNFEMTGSKLFVGDFDGPVYVYEAKDGAFVTELLPGPGVSGWRDANDHYMGLRALVTGDEYFVATYENRGNAHFAVQRLNPTACKADVGCDSRDACRGFWHF